MPEPTKVQRLTDEEITKLRALITRQERVDWVWTTVKTYALWITAVGIGGTAFWDFFVKLIAKAVASGVIK